LWMLDTFYIRELFVFSLAVLSVIVTIFTVVLVERSFGWLAFVAALLVSVPACGAVLFSNHALELVLVNYAVAWTDALMIIAYILLQIVCGLYLLRKRVTV
ncbi:MAG: hypothetical protein ACRC5C_00115, partial [Bacilli bacterium]